MFANGVMSDLVHNVVPLAAVIMIFGMPIAVVVAGLIYKTHRDHMLHETIQRLVMTQWRTRVPRVLERIRVSVCLIRLQRVTC